MWQFSERCWPHRESRQLPYVRVGVEIRRRARGVRRRRTFGDHGEPNGLARVVHWLDIDGDVCGNFNHVIFLVDSCPNCLLWGHLTRSPDAFTNTPTQTLLREALTPIWHPGCHRPPTNKSSMRMHSFPFQGFLRSRVFFQLFESRNIKASLMTPTRNLMMPDPGPARSGVDSQTPRGRSGHSLFCCSRNMSASETTQVS